MSESPLIFSVSSVNRILEGMKTQTRRVITPQAPNKDYVIETDYYGQLFYVLYGEDKIRDSIEITCRFNPGEILWVREPYRESEKGFAFYEADYCNGKELPFYPNEEKPWRNPMFMPKEYSRIRLYIEEVRFQKLQEITAMDACEEGMDGITGDYVEQYRQTWDAINLRRGYGWEFNPWVAAITFRRR